MELFSKRHYKSIDPFQLPIISSGWVLSCFVKVLCCLVIPATSFADQMCQVMRSADYSFIGAPRHRQVSGDVFSIMYDVTETLISVDGDLQIQPGLAKSWQIDEENRSILFTLDETCGWSDGRPVTATDVATGIEALYRHEDIAIPGWTHILNARKVSRGEEPVETLGVTVLSESQLRVDFDVDPYVGLQVLSYPSFGPLPTHFMSSIDDVPGFGIGPNSGPYRVENYDNDRIRLTRNEYFCSRNMIDGMFDSAIVHRSETVANNVAMFVAGETDVIDSFPQRQLESFMTLFSPSEKPRIIVSSAYRNIFLLANPSSSRIADPEVRNYLRGAIDFGGLTVSTQTAASAYGLSNSVFHEIGDYVNVQYEAPISYAQGVERLRERVRELGYGPDNPMRLTITTFPKMQMVELARKLIAMYRRAYIEFELIENNDMDSAINRLQRGSYDIFLAHWILDFPDIVNSWQGVKITLQERIKNGLQGTGQRPATELLALIEDIDRRLERARSKEERYVIFNEAERALTELDYVIPILTGHRIGITRSHIKVARNAFQALTSARQLANTSSCSSVVH